MRTDVLLNNTTGDLLLLNHDVVIGESDGQHIEDHLRSYPGEYKQSPLVGVYLHRAINGLLNGVVRRDVRIALEADKYRVNQVQFTEENLLVDAVHNS